MAWHGGYVARFLMLLVVKKIGDSIGKNSSRILETEPSITESSYFICMENIYSVLLTCIC